jgi:hypothetical protein
MEVAKDEAALRDLDRPALVALRTIAHFAGQGHRFGDIRVDEGSVAPLASAVDEAGPFESAMRSFSLGGTHSSPDR